MSAAGNTSLDASVNWTFVEQPILEQDNPAVTLLQSTLGSGIDPNYASDKPLTPECTSDISELVSKQVSKLVVDPQILQRTPAEIAQALTQSSNPADAPDAPKAPCDWLKTAAIASLIIFGILTAICALCATGIYPPEMMGGSIGLTYSFGVGLSGIAIGAALFFLSMQSEKEELPAHSKA